LSEGPARGSEIAAAAGSTQNRLSSKVPLLEALDVIIKEDLHYRMIWIPVLCAWEEDREKAN